MNLSKTIIASSIANLTDARYFAGWMVDYLHFDFRQQSPDQITIEQFGEILSWVEGPKILLSIDEHFNEDSLQNVPIFGYIKNSDSSQFDDPNIQKLIVEKQNGKIFGVITTDKPTANLDSVQVFADFNSVDNWQEAEWADGFMVYGGPEEKVGIKTYDDLDDLFEHLSDWE